MRPIHPDRTRIWKCWFFGQRKIRVPGEKPSEQDENQQQSQPTNGIGRHSPTLLSLQCCNQFLVKQARSNCRALAK